MKKLKTLFDNNKKWATAMRSGDPKFFARLAEQQAPKYLWIGCSDSRVPANQIVGLLPGEIFVHRNVANLVVHTDFNCLSVIQFAVEVLSVEHIIVCGHYGCSGVGAALGNSQFGLIDNWLRHIKDVYSKHEATLAPLDRSKQFDRLCELNVVEQMFNVCHTTTIQKAWSSGRALSVHGWIYSLTDGLLQDLGVTVDNAAELQDVYRTSIH